MIRDGGLWTVLWWNVGTWVGGAAVQWIHQWKQQQQNQQNQKSPALAAPDEESSSSLLSASAPLSCARAEEDLGSSLRNNNEDDEEEEEKAKNRHNVPKLSTDSIEQILLHYNQKNNSRRLHQPSHLPFQNASFTTSPSSAKSSSSSSLSSITLSLFPMVLQVLRIKPLPGGNRYRLTLSDGQFMVDGLDATSGPTGSGPHGQISEYALVEIQHGICRWVQDRIVLIVGRLRVLGQPGGRWGNPVPVPLVYPLPDLGRRNGQRGHHGRRQHPTMARHRQELPLAETEQRPRSCPAMSASDESRTCPVLESGLRQPLDEIETAKPELAPHANKMVTVDQLEEQGLDAQFPWTLRARITSKSDIRCWCNAKGNGYFFQVELLDSKDMDVRAVFFNQAVDRFYQQLHVGKVYFWSRGRLKTANPKWNTCQSKLEIVFDSASDISLDNHAKDFQWSEQKYDFVSIAALEKVVAGTVVDILAVVRNVGKVTHHVSKKTGKELDKCDLTLIDETETQVTLTLWGDCARQLRKS